MGSAPGRATVALVNSACHVLNVLNGYIEKMRCDSSIATSEHKPPGSPQEFPAGRRATALTAGDLVPAGPG
jgi:hypothetical protein